MYSITEGLPFFLQKTPTFSCGFALTTDFPAAVTCLSIAIPINIGSTIFTKQLSTPPINIHSAPSSLIFLVIPFLTRASYIPPCPFAASFIKPSSPIKIFPSISIIGNSSCLKKNKFLSFSYPKFLFWAKNSIVSSLFSLLVIINHGIVTPYLRPCSFKPSLSNSNNDLCDSSPISKVPFGPLCPSLVPCPPAIVTATNFLFLIASVPIA